MIIEQKQIPYNDLIRAGRRILINAESVERYLTTGEAQGSSVPKSEHIPAPSGGRIAPIPLKDGVAGGR